MVRGSPNLVKKSASILFDNHFEYLYLIFIKKKNVFK